VLQAGVEIDRTCCSPAFSEHNNEQLCFQNVSNPDKHALLLSVMDLIGMGNMGGLKNARFGCGRASAASEIFVSKLLMAMAVSLLSL